MVAKLLMAASAGILLLLGAAHLFYTFSGNLLAPRDPALQASMSQISPVITNQTTMWRCWVGFNASHSMGLLLFGAVFGYLALAHSEMLFRSTFLLLVGLATVCGYVALSKFYFFSSPAMGTSVALACYVASAAIARLRG